MVLAVYEGWSLQELMTIYWAQSVVIGYFNFRRMLHLKQFSTKGVKENGVRPAENAATKRRAAIFFALHYGGFHAGYMAFLIPGISEFQGSWLMLIVCTIVFFLNHRYSYFNYREQDQERKPNIGTIMFFPYARVVPMHLMIIFGHAIGPTTATGLLLFLALKTAADVVMHKIEHSRWRKLP